MWRTRNTYIPLPKPDPPTGNFRWGWALWDVKDRYVIGEALIARGWQQSPYAFKLNASYLDQPDQLGPAEQAMLNTLFPAESRQYWEDHDLTIDLRLLKAPGKRQIEPQFWKDNPNATPELHYQLQVNLTGVYPISATSPTMAVVAKFDWKKFFSDREAAAQTALPYSMRPTPEIKRWQVRHSGANPEAGYNCKGTARTGSKVIGRANTFEVSVEPCVKIYLGIIKPSDPLGTIIQTGLDTLCTEVVKRVQDIIACAPIANKAERYIAKKLADEMLDNG